MRRWISLALIAVSGVAVAQDFGPIETRNHRSVDLPFLRLDPRPPVLGAGEQTLSVGMTFANDLRYMKQGALRLGEDYEVDELLARWRKGLGRGTDLTVDLPLLSRGGGWMDPLMDWWHQHVLGIYDNLRRYVPYGRSEVILPGDPRFGSAAGIGDVSAVLTHRLRPNLMGEIGIQAPTGDAGRLLGAGNVDAAAAVQASIPVRGPFRLDLQGGVVYQGNDRWLAGQRAWVHQEAIVFQYRRNRRDNWILQWQSEASAVVTGISGSDSTQRVVSLGYQRALSSRRTFEVFFTEDGDWLNYRVPEIANIGPDFTFGLRLVSRF